MNDHEAVHGRRVLRQGARWLWTSAGLPPVARRPSTREETYDFTVSTSYKNGPSLTSAVVSR